MRIFSDEDNKKLDEVSLFLTKDEARQLQGYIEEMLDNSENHHFHLSTDDFQKEITICLYDQSQLEGFNSRVRKLIIEDK